MKVSSQQSAPKGTEALTLSAISKEQGVIKQEQNYITAKVKHFTLFALMAQVSAINLDNAIVYPNPYKPNSGLGHTEIYFDGLTSDVKIRIYTISGRLVKTIETATTGRYSWDGRNEEGENVVSGVYIYIITSTIPSASGSNVAKGKIAIIR